MKRPTRLAGSLHQTDLGALAGAPGIAGDSRSPPVLAAVTSTPIGLNGFGRDQPGVIAGQRLEIKREGVPFGPGPTLFHRSFSLLGPIRLPEE